MVHKALTDRTLQTLSAPHQVYVWDTVVKGFGVRVGPNRKAFVVIRNGRRKTLGLYPALALKDARRQAQQALLGPFSAPTSPKTEVAIKDYLRSLEARPRTLRDYERLLDRHLKPHASRRLSDITKQHILNITDGLRHTPSECLHAHAVMRSFFNWAAARSLISASPMDKLPSPVSPKQRERLLSDNEVKLIWHAATGDFGRLIKICLLTGMRRSEVAAMEPDWIHGDTLVIPSVNRRAILTPVWG